MGKLPNVDEMFSKKKKKGIESVAVFCVWDQGEYSSE